ncbi:MAG: S-methyl-5'-thioadenosine phosphorylase [Candidatus Bathyarchaeia archaeon]
MANSQPFPKKPKGKPELESESKAKNENIPIPIHELKPKLNAEPSLKTGLGASIAIIGGTGFEKALSSPRLMEVETPFQYKPTVYLGEVSGHPVIFLPRHGIRHEFPPHRVPYKANIWCLRHLGIERIVATNLVGSINPLFKPGDLVVPDDLIDFTKGRDGTFYHEMPVVHIDFTKPYCPQIRRALIKAIKGLGEKVWDRAVYVCTEGPRYETPAEIHMFRRLGADIVGMTSCPEASLARELGICYASICLVSNMAAGMQRRLTTKEVMKVAEERGGILLKAIEETIRLIPEARRCGCRRSLDEASL